MPQIKHVVFMKIKPEVPPALLAKAMDDLARIKQKLPGFLDFSWGPDASADGLARGFTHGFAITFADAKARDAYLPHPDHEAVKLQLIEMLDGGIEGVIVLDWEV